LYWVNFLSRPHLQPIGSLVIILVLAIGSLGWGQIEPATGAPLVRIRSMRVIAGGEGPAIEIISTHPLTPKITTLRNPSRLVIDLPDSLLTPRKQIDFRSDQINGIRANQFQTAPPISRVVVDLAKPIGYSWDAAGNRLMIRLKPLEQKIAPAPLPRDNAPDLAVNALGSSGASVQTVARTEGQGSSLTAGNDTAIMHLPRGGQVRVCPSTTVSVNYSKNGHDMLLAMNTGALEAHYVLDTSADAVITPDFRILFAGPGEFDFAISTDSRGNTCVRSLRGNTGSVIVSQLLGDGAYQVKPSEQVMFHAGQISQRSTETPANCGCPEAEIPELLASAGHPQSAAATNQPPDGTDSSMTRPLPESDKVHIKVDAPFVFHGGGEPAPSAPEMALLSLSAVDRTEPLEVTVLPPPPQMVASKPRNGGFFGKIKGFFAAIFR
jgi:hypothetical protein